MARKEHVPTVEELKKLTKLATPYCLEIRKIIGRGMKAGTREDVTLEDIRDYIASLDPNHDLATAQVERLEVSLYHSGNPYFEESIGYYLNLGDTYDDTIVYVDEEGILGNHAENDPVTGARKWVLGARGWYAGYSWGDVLQNWEEKTRNNLTEDDIEDMGPDSDSDCDIWTDDGRHFWIYRHGMHVQERNGRDRLAFAINAPTPPEYWADRAQRVMEKRDEAKQAFLDADDEIQWIKRNFNTMPTANAANLRFHEQKRREAALAVDYWKQKHADIVKKVDSFDEPWDGSSDARDECDRMGVWFHIHKYQSTHCSGNVWFRRGNGRNWEWKLIRWPKNYRYFSRTQEWREAFRRRKYTQVQEEAAAKAAQKAEVGAVPQKGDLYSYNLLQPGMLGIEVFVFDGRRGNAGLGPILTIRKGDPWSAIHHALRQQRVHLGRKVHLWVAPDWLSGPETWALVTPPPER